MSSAPVENTEVPPASQEVQKTNEEEEEVNPEPQEAKMPTRKDVSLKEFLNKMDDYAPIVSRAAQKSIGLLLATASARLLPMANLYYLSRSPTQSPISISLRQVFHRRHRLTSVSLAYLH